MVVFIINNIILLLSVFLLVYNYRFIKNDENDLEARITKYVAGSISLLLFGIILVATSLIASRKFDVDIDTFLLVIAIIIAVAVYVLLILVWNKMFSLFTQSTMKTLKKQYGYQFKSVTIYGLVYSFGILFHLLYSFILF